MMQGFSGFPPGKSTTVKIPALFFGELLPIIDNLVELKVTLYCFWALSRQEGKYRYVRFSEALADELFAKTLTNQPADYESVLRDGFERAVARGTLLAVDLQMQAQHDTLYFMNTANGRAALDSIERGDWLPGNFKRPIQLIIERPNIFVLYEQNIGPITPMIADELRIAEADYPLHWIEDAIMIAVQQNKRSWSYVRAILERWLSEGKRSNGATQKHTSRHHNPEDERAEPF
jgi:DNA replication protein